MPVDAIGSTLGSSSAVQNTTLNQQEFLKLFITELNFQDPLEPINNREFLAQMAQFAGLEQSRQTTESIDNLVFMNSTVQSLGLLGKQIEVVGEGGSLFGVVSAVEFTPSGPALSVRDANGNVTTSIKLSQIRLVRN